MMKTTYRDRYGTPDILTVKEVELREPQSHQLVIRVMATTVNRTDCGVLTGSPYIFRFFVGWPKPRHFATGTDFAGVVEAVGSQVQGFKIGDRLWGFHDHGLGSHAEYLTLSERLPILPIPEGISFEQAAASAEGAHYAINFLRYLKLQKGDRVLVNGATGAIGSAAVQLLKHRGIRVTATCPGAHTHLVSSLGAEEVIDYEREDFTLCGSKFQYVLDAVGKSSFGICRKLLLSGGAYLSSELGPGNENVYLPITTRWSERRVIFPVPTDIRRSLGEINNLLATGAFRPVIDRRYALADVADAFRYAASGQKIGNVLLRPFD